MSLSYDEDSIDYEELEAIIDSGLDENLVMEILGEDEEECIYHMPSLEDMLYEKESDIDLLMGTMVRMRRHGTPEGVINLMAAKIQTIENICRQLALLAN